MPANANYQPPAGATLNDVGFWIMPNGDLAPGQVTPGMTGSRGGVQFDPTRNLSYTVNPNGSRNWISPVAFDPNTPTDSPSFFHHGSTWNTQTGQMANPFDWGSLVTLGAGAGLAAPFVVPALAGLGGGAGGGLVGSGEVGLSTGGAASGVTGVGATVGGALPAAAGTAAGTAAGVLPATQWGGIAPGLSNAGIVGPASGTGINAIGGGGSSLIGTLANNRLIGQGASLALGAIGGGIPDQASNTSTTTRPLDPAFSPLQNQLIQMIMGRLQSGDSLPAGYEGTGIKNINSTYDAADLSRNADLTRRGLASSPIAGASDAGFQSRRAGTIADFRSSLPLVSRDLQTQDLGLAANLLNFGRNSTTTTGTQQQGGGTAGVLENLAGILAMYYGSR
jgi:hypothetical protein